MEEFKFRLGYTGYPAFFFDIRKIMNLTYYYSISDSIRAGYLGIRRFLPGPFLQLFFRKIQDQIQLIKHIV